MLRNLTIIKRDGREVPFSKDKIVSAVLKAFIAVDKTVDDYAKEKANNIADYIEKEIISAQSERKLSVEEIQDMVEKGLMATKRKNVAKEYITYRHERDIIRTRNSKLRNLVMEKLTAKNIANQNANVDERSFGGRIGESSSVQLRDIALNDILSPMAKENHLNNEIYIHDLDSYAVGSHNCLSIPFDKLLWEGFNTRQADVRPANSVNTAFQLLAVIFQLQSLQQFGGVSATHLDWTMIPYVRLSFYKHLRDGFYYLGTSSSDYKTFSTVYSSCLKRKEKEDFSPYRKNFNDFFNKGLRIDLFNLSDYFDKDFFIPQKVYEYAIDMTQRELSQAVEGMFHNLNTLQSRSGNQLPFTSINFGTCTLPEGRMVTKAILEGCIKGVGKFHKTSIFPCVIFQCMKGINREKGDPNYDLFQLALKSTAQRLYPNYANVDWSGNAGYDINDVRTYFSTMGCRTANGMDINGFGQLKDGRGNICPVTIILPTLAMIAKDNAIKNSSTAEEAFLNLLDEKIHEAKDMLIERFDWICSQSPSSAKFMYENNVMEGYDPEEGIKSALCHGTLAMGQIGLAEALQILIGCDQTEEKGMELAKKIEQLFKERCAEFKKHYQLNFGVYYSPAENLCHTAMMKFKAKYGEIPNVSDKDFFTNSIHVPVWKEISVFDKINIESQLTGYSSAGCITYIELESSIKNNLSALEKMVNFAMDKDIPYFAVNVPVDTCLECGYTDDMGDTCLECGGHSVQHLRRVTGYLTGDYRTAFNKGKQQEVEKRSKHWKGEI